MGYRQVNSDIWVDEKFMGMSQELKFFWLYLLTCSHSKACGIFKLPLLYVSAETQKDIGSIKQYIKELVDLKLCCYSEQTNEIAIFNYPKYNIKNSGKPVIDMIRKELEVVKNKVLIEIVVLTLNAFYKAQYDETKQLSFKNVLLTYIDYLPNDKKEKVLREIDNTYNDNNTNTNIYTNNNINNVSLDDTSHDTSKVDWNKLIADIENAGRKDQDDESELPF